MSKMNADTPTTFLQRVDHYIREHRLLTADATYLVALSGGADSVALLLALRLLHYRVEAVHCNFHLRGDESDADEVFCTELCRKWNIPLHLVHFDTLTYASLHHVSIEMAARNLRYEYFEKLRKDIAAAGICVAHHQDDKVETVLLNLVRGTGIYGLTGMKPRNGKVLRPLLCVDRTSILLFLEQQQQPYRTDSSNLVPNVQRNKIRLDIIPQLQQINPAAARNILKMTDYLSSVERIVEKAVSDVRRHVVVSETPERLTLNIEALRKESFHQELLWYLLKDYGFHQPQVAQIVASLTTGTGKLWESKTHRLTINRHLLLVQPFPTESPAVHKLPEPGNYRLSNTLHFLLSIEEKALSYIIGKEQHAAYLDADKVAFPLTLRPFRQGERFVPFGMTGQKLISDYLTDRQCSLFDKEQQLVLTDASGEVIWLVNQRPDNRYKITPHTRKVLKILSLNTTV